MREINSLKPRVKILGDAGIYTAWIIDWYNQKALINRACGDEWVKFENIQGFMWPIDLNDKNGKEVYEGDVVEDTNPMFPEDRIMEIKWYGHGAGFALYNHSKNYKCFCGWIHDCPKRFIVIGDIYTTPELLKEDK